MKKKLANITYSKIEINKESIKKILNEEKWPWITYPKINKHILWRKNIIRPTIKLKQEANKIFDKNIDWNTKKLYLKDTMKESFIKYWSRLDMQSKLDTAQFYKIVNSLLRYKSRGKIVKGIRHEERQ